MQLEAIAERLTHHGALPRVMSVGPPWLIDWQPLLPLLLDEAAPLALRAGVFHQILADTITALALRARKQHLIHTVGLSGGVFQNKLLTERVCEQLQQHGFTLKLSRHVPCNDGGIAFGQVIEYLYRQEQRTP